MHDDVHLPLVAADGDAPGHDRVDVHGLEDLLDPDGRFAGMDEVPGLDEEGFGEAGHVHPSATPGCARADGRCLVAGSAVAVQTGQPAGVKAAAGDEHRHGR